MTGRTPRSTLHGALTAATESDAGALAVAAPDGELTYGELSERSGRIAAALAELGVERGDRVAVAAEKSTWTVAAMYGVMRAGASYVPIDPLAPPVRAAGIIRDAGCRALCADAAAAASLMPALADDAPNLLGLVDDVDGATIGPAGIDQLPIHARDPGDASDLAYILYTSGSTGVPKGVMLTHGNALSFVEWAVDRFAVTGEDRLSSHAPFHFDLSVFDLYAAALAGATVDLLTPAERGFGPEMARAISERSITVWYSVPSALIMLCDTATSEALARLRVVLFAGEVYPMKHLRRLRAMTPHAVLANLYGPTETNVCTYHVVPSELPAGDDKPLPIGIACENQEVFALDPERRMVPYGEIGELYVRGPTVMQGYWGDPERTAQSLGQNPLHDSFPDPTYRTGDLVRRMPGEVFEFLGRRDHQIKSRGYRIELGEIEAALASHPAVKEAVVVPVPDERIGTALVAVVVPGDVVEEIELKRHCRDRLPRYMIPGTVLVRNELPRTSTGKVDRQAVAAAVAEMPGIS